MLIFRIGSLEHKIFPNSETFEKMRQQVKNLDKNGGVIIWGPDLEVISIDDDREIKIIGSDQEIK